MTRTIKLLLASVAMLAVMCSGACAVEKKLSELTGEDRYKWQDGNTYVIDQSMSINERIIVTGGVTLVLTDGFTLSADQGINVSNGNELIITTPDAPNGTGVLIANADGMEMNAAIGGDKFISGGNITINGGIVNATCNSQGAAIGGGGHGGSGGIITINGGIVTAISNNYGTVSQVGAAIGGGHSGSGGIITINGGMVNATCSRAGAAIGGGSNGSGGTITIAGGTVIAKNTGAEYDMSSGGDANAGAGIGGGYYGSGGTITICGGTVTATGSGGASGIGGGDHGDGGTITINGGTVTATSNGGAGIGGGQEGDCGEITISGGTVTATSDYGAGIGGGDYADGGNITINGGTVTATSEHGDGIGGGLDSTDGGTLSSDPNGNAWIVTNSVGAKTNVSGKNFKSGVLFDGNDGKVYGDQTVSGDVAIPNDATLEIPTGASLTIPEGAKLDASGGTLVNSGGTITNDGTVMLATGVDIKSLSMTGSGTVKQGGKTHKNSGSQYHQINVTPSDHGTASADLREAASDDTVMLKATPRNGYVFGAWVTTPPSLDITGTEDAELKMPDAAVTVTATFKPLHAITVNNDGHGTGSARPTSAASDDIVMLTARPQNGYVLDEWVVVKPTGLTIADDDTFKMPNEAVEIKARFRSLLPKEHTITVTDDGHGIGSARPRAAVAGDVVTLSFAMNAGYMFDRWEGVKPAGLTIERDKFTMPDEDVEIKATFRRDPKLKNFHAYIISGETTDAWDAGVGGGITMVIKQPFANFSDEVWIDGLMLDEDEYTATAANSVYLQSAMAVDTADATRITIPDEVIKLHITQNGEHDLTVGFIDGEATLIFKVTGLDNGHVGGGVCSAGFGLAAIIAIAALAMMKRKTK